MALLPDKLLLRQVLFLLSLLMNFAIKYLQFQIPKVI